MHPSRLFGYEHRANGTVVITRGCRIAGVVRGDSEVDRFLTELAEATAGTGRQQVLARWVTGAVPAA
ncbi:hypothetical protein [Streptomyces showdoensis]|uniref:Uncharacterized protein n=1 Tax=Streptomyces showdoensis TaxID=68268 RepID=A0A2P2GGE1_STREW|nr:hypothetical protein [Streptomyces showdoensis]KKZ70571.1 hypothetical protein VO63_28240 [Streptomyces showdoensis]